MITQIHIINVYTFINVCSNTWMNIRTTRHKIEDKKKNDSNYHQVGNFYLMTVWYTVMSE